MAFAATCAFTLISLQSIDPPETKPEMCKAA
jgi:hypothetical protein